jgi:hypothetical protein
MTKTYVKRTPEQMISDLEAEIERVKARAVTKAAAAEVRGSPDGVAFLAAVKAVDRAIRVAGEQRNDAMVRALEAARAPLGEHLIAMGLRLPDRKARRGGRRRKGEAA